MYLFKCFLISLGIHLFIIVCIFLFEEEFSKSKTDILKVEILSNNENVVQVLKKKEKKKEKKERKKTLIKQSDLANFMDNEQYFTLNKEYSIKNLKDQKEISKDINVLINNRNQGVEKNVKSRNNSEKVFSKATYKLGSEKNPHPPYPIIARKEGWQGKLVLHVFINKNGGVKNIELLKSSGYKVLDNVSLETVKKWSFKPAQLGKRYVEDKIKIPLRFVLDK